MVDGVSIELVPQLCFLPILTLVDVFLLGSELLLLSGDVDVLGFWKLYPEFPGANDGDGDDVGDVKEDDDGVVYSVAKYVL